LNCIAKPPIEPIRGIGPARGASRIGRGIVSWLLVPFFLVGKWYSGKAASLDDPSREIDGLTIVLTGVQGRSLLEQQIALGIADAGVPGRIEIVDWTTGNPLRFLQHLRGHTLAAEAAVQLAERIAAYRAKRPGCPVHVVGYSGGGYVALLLLEALPADIAITTASILAPSVSPQFEVVPLTAKTACGLTHFCSPFDLAVLGLLTIVVGTTDGRHTPSAGLVGFQNAGGFIPTEVTLDEPPRRYRQLPFRLKWISQFHLGGHLGYANRIWACETLGRVLVRSCEAQRIAKAEARGIQ
jgi:pimeloyl-ACP methyl ester carboxylesterase